MKRNGFVYSFLSLLIALNIFIIGCYQPVANVSEEFDNKEGESHETTDTARHDINRSSEITTTDNEADAGNETMDTRNRKQPKRVTGFRNNLSEHLGIYGQRIQDIVDENNAVERRILHEYGSVFLTKAMPPSKAMFTSDLEVAQFQSKAGVLEISVGGIRVELQPEASRALLSASLDAERQGLSITPRDREDSARRSYSHTQKLWDGRFQRASEYWNRKGKLTTSRIAELASMPIKNQVAAVLELEERGIYFSTDFKKSILYSVAAPGTSQHLSMLAFDVKEFRNENVRKILAKHGWFRTVQSDAPHFTYLGYGEDELESLGLKKITTDGGFWIPNV